MICYFAIIFIMVIGFMSFGIVNYNMQQENTSLLEELNNNQALLLFMEDELVKEKNNFSEMQNKFNEEINRSATLQEELDNANVIIGTLKDEEYIVGFTVTNAEINMLAKTVWGEARGTNKMEQSAVVWCILNRVDAGWGTIAEVVTAPNQFHGYSSNFPVTDEIKALVEDVIARWKLEKVCGGNVGRTLPTNYLYFRADSTGLSNVFRTEWSGNYDVWNWDCWNPYE